MTGTNGSAGRRLTVLVAPESLNLRAAVGQTIDLILEVSAIGGTDVAIRVFPPENVTPAWEARQLAIRPTGEVSRISIPLRAESAVVRTQIAVEVALGETLLRRVSAFFETL